MPATFTSSSVITPASLTVPSSCSCFATRSSGGQGNEKGFHFRRSVSCPAGLRSLRAGANSRPGVSAAESAALLRPERGGGPHALRDGRDPVLCRGGGQTRFPRGGDQQLGGHDRRKPEAVPARRLAQQPATGCEAAG